VPVQSPYWVPCNSLSSKATVVPVEVTKVIVEREDNRKSRSKVEERDEGDDGLVFRG